jgi:hypothetical protein
VFAPLALANSTLDFNEKLSSGRLVPGYAAGRQLPYYNLVWNQPAGGVWTSPRDLDRVAALFLYNNNNNNNNNAFGARSTLLQAARATYRNADGTTGFGMPFEMRFEDSYTIARKGGNLPGYATLLSFSAQLGLSINVNWNGAVDENAVSVQLYDLLIPPLRAALLTAQKAALPPPPPGPGLPPFVGTYLDPSGATALVAIVTPHYPTMLAVKVFGFSVLTRYVAERSDNATARFQIAPPGYLPLVPAGCLSQEELGFNGQYVVFRWSSSRGSYQVTIPGLVPGVTFSR